MEPINGINEMYANEEAVPFRGNSLFICAYFISTFYPLLLGILQRAVCGFVLTQDLFLSALFGGLCIGISLALIIRLGASTGGMDIPPLVLQKLFRIPVSVSLYVFDFIPSQ